MTIADFRSLASASDPFDLCIVGGGAVGLTLAAALAATGLRLLVLEAGDRKLSPQRQDPFRGQVADPTLHSPLHHFRVRALGGSSQIWGGRCMPYDPIDFEPRPWVPHSGWPIGFDDLRSYYALANEAAEAGPFDYAVDKPMVPGLDTEWLQTTLERFSRPTDFSRRYGATLAGAANVQVVLRTTVTAVRLHPNASGVDHLEVVVPDGRRLQVRAGAYVLAAGGLETTRLLLASQDVQQGGVGNASGWLGRGYMCHLSAILGTVTFTGAPTAIAGGYERDAQAVYLRRRIAVTPLAQRQLNVLNLTFRLHVGDITDPSHHDPVLSLLYLARHVMRYEYRQRLWDARLPLTQRHLHMRNVLRHPMRLATFMASMLHKRYLSDRRIPSLALFAPDNRYGLEFHSEQAPNPDSRITLAEERDAFGMPRLHVDWRWNALDMQTVRKSYNLLATELERTGTGRLRFDQDRLEDIVLAHGAFGGHHIGTARMSDNPANGVVDRNCQVHGIANLFLAGSTVFPTSSQANPTLTALALAFRLADHLKEQAVGSLRMAPQRERVFGDNV